MGREIADREKVTREKGQGYLFWKDKELPLHRGEIDRHKDKWWFI